MFDAECLVLLPRIIARVDNNGPERSRRIFIVSSCLLTKSTMDVLCVYVLRNVCNMCSSYERGGPRLRLFV